MKRRTRTVNAMSFLRWEFARRHQHVMCAIRAASTSCWEVATIPLWDVSGTAIETFSTASEALRRHAAIAADLRDNGWRMAAYTS